VQSNSTMHAEQTFRPQLLRSVITSWSGRAPNAHKTVCLNAQSKWQEKEKSKEAAKSSFVADHNRCCASKHAPDSLRELWRRL